MTSCQTGTALAADATLRRPADAHCLAGSRDPITLTVPKIRHPLAVVLMGELQALHARSVLLVDGAVTFDDCGSVAALEQREYLAVPVDPDLP